MINEIASVSHPRRILHIFKQMRPGGAELRTLDLMEQIDRSRYIFDFLVISGKRGELDERIEEMGGKIYYVKPDLFFLFNCYKIFKNNKFHALQSHIGLYSGIVLKLAAWAGIRKRLVHFRSVSDGQSPSRIYKLSKDTMRRWIDIYATDILAVNEGSIRNMWGENWKKDSRCKILSNGFNLSLYQGPTLPHTYLQSEVGVPEDSFLLIHVGNLREPKNHLRLVSIFSKILHLKPNAWLLLVGRNQNSYADLVRDKVGALGLSERIIFAGPRDDVPQLLKLSRLMLLPSNWEGLPGAVLEACAAGIPVLGSDVPGVKEIASSFPYVRFLSLDRSDEEWAEKTLELYSEAKSNWSQELALQYFRKSPFSMERCLSDYYSVLESTTKENG